ncbi:MFS transporter [Peribacillus castrilensis]|uniref:MFS transporter n=1 Tax=Bacillaceae TaxID=186817 RepID=UPI000660893F|nr:MULTISPECIES: MFS transporter [Bacillaceae]PRA81571.1 MFS transporter [Peribacillus simplex]
MQKIPNDKNVMKLYFIGFFGNNFFDRAIWMIYFTHLGFSLLQIAILQAILNATQFLSEIPTGLISDKYGRKVSLIVARMFIICYMLGFMFFDSFYLIAVAQVFYGVGLTCISGADQSLLYDTLKDKKLEKNYSKIIGRYFAIVILALAISMSIGGFLQELSWSTVYLFGVICQSIALLITLNLKESSSYNTNKTRKVSDLIGEIKLFLKLNPNLRLYLIGIGIFYAIGSVYYMYNQVLFDQMGIPTYIISLLFGIDSIVAAVASINAYKLESKFTARIVFSFCLNATVVMFLLLFTKTNFWVLIGFFGVSLIYNTLEPIASNVLNLEVSSEKRNTMLSMTKFLSTFIMFLSFPLIAFLTKFLSVYYVLAITGAFTMFISSRLISKFFSESKIQLKFLKEKKVL